VFLNTHVHYICFHKYIPIFHFIKKIKIKIKKFNILLRLYIICKNIVKLFQKFEAGYIQTCTPLKNSIM